MYALLPIIALAASASATTLQSRGLMARNAMLASRQLDPNSVPAACQSQCNPVITKLQTCSTDISCLCSADTASQLKGCVQCGISQGGSQVTPTVIQQAQDSINQYVQACDAGGQSIAPISISTGGAGGGGATGGGVTATATGGSANTLTSVGGANPTLGGATGGATNTLGGATGGANTLGGATGATGATSSSNPFGTQAAGGSGSASGAISTGANAVLGLGAISLVFAML